MGCFDKVRILLTVIEFTLLTAWLTVELDLRLITTHTACGRLAVPFANEVNEAPCSGANRCELCEPQPGLRLTSEQRARGKPETHFLSFACGFERLCN